MTHDPTVPRDSTPDNRQPARNVPEPDTSVDAGINGQLADSIGKLEHAVTSSPSTAPDPYDPESLRLSQDFTASIGVRKALLTVPIRKPDKSWFNRTHPDPKYRLTTAIIELRDERGGEIYLVAPALLPELVGESTLSLRALVMSINRQGVPFLWPLRLPGPDGRVDGWIRTALEAADLATKKWVRLVANMGISAYDVYEALGKLPDPDWPDVPLRDLLHVAFRDRLIDTLDHPVLRKLRREI